MSSISCCVFFYECLLFDVKDIIGIEFDMLIYVVDMLKQKELILEAITS